MDSKMCFISFLFCIKYFGNCVFWSVSAMLKTNLCKICFFFLLLEGSCLYHLFFYPWKYRFFFLSQCSHLESYFMSGILQISIFNKTNFLRNPVGNFEENIDEIILAHYKENFLCVCKVLRGVRNGSLPSFLSETAM